MTNEDERGSTEAWLVFERLHTSIAEIRRSLLVLGGGARAADLSAAGSGLLSALGSLESLADRLRSEAASVSQAVVDAAIGKSSSTDILLSLGSGTRELDGWISIDLRHGDVRADLIAGIPLADNIVSGLYCAHFLEHLYYPDQTTAFLTECLRVLRPGGVSRFVVPDARSLLTAYVDREQHLLEARQRALFGVVDDRPSLEGILNYLGAPYTSSLQAEMHKYAFDEELLIDLLDSVGFVEVSVAAYGRGRRPELLVDHTSVSASRFAGRWSLFVEAECPGAQAC